MICANEVTPDVASGLPCCKVGGLRGEYKKDLFNTGRVERMRRRQNVWSALPPTRLGSVVAAHPAKHTDAQPQAVLGLQYLLLDKKCRKKSLRN